MTRVELFTTELSLLRGEIRDLKQCQVRYFSLSVLGTGAILGLTKVFPSQNLIGICYLTPLAIILPCWSIFFDKAHTITRIVGYVRLLEQELSFSYEPYFNSRFKFIGFERALKLYRDLEDNPKANVSLEEENAGAISATRHRYWNLNWLIFLLLSLFCCFLAILSTGLDATSIAMAVVSVMLLISPSMFTFRILKRLRRACIHNWNEKFWRSVTGDYWDLLTHKYVLPRDAGDPTMLREAIDITRGNSR
jgi:hypothetical protein